jgi:hypothetical protein
VHVVEFFTQKDDRSLLIFKEGSNFRESRFYVPPGEPADYSFDKKGNTPAQARSLFNSWSIKHCEPLELSPAVTSVLFRIVRGYWQVMGIMH